MRNVANRSGKLGLMLLVLALAGCQMLIGPSSFAQASNTVGLITNTDGAYEGFTLFAPQRSTSTYLINMSGEIVHTWPASAQPGNSVYLLEDGSILRTYSVGPQNNTFSGGGSGGGVQKISWDGEVIWDFLYSSGQHLQHHDAEFLPSGNVLIIAWELRTETESLAAGRNPNLLSDGELWPDTIVEFNPDSSEIIWEWKAWDHLIQDYDSSRDNFGVVSDHPELIDINFANAAGGADWLHVNAVDFNAELDQIILSNHNFSEVWIIDHSTTIAEAASHAGGRYGMGGDLLYRWGNPQAYGTGNVNDQQLYAQHDSQWIVDGLPGAGNILVFNNGNQRARPYTTILEFSPLLNADGSYDLVSGQSFGPAQPVWTYEADPSESFFAMNISGAQRLPNGNTLICDGPAGRFFEVTSAGEVVWDYINPVVSDEVLSNEEAEALQNQQNIVFRAVRYAPDHPAFAERDL